MVTGSRGFIGSNFRKICPDVMEFDVVKDRRQSILNKDAVNEFLDENKPNTILHLAANPLASKSVMDPHYDMSLNINGTLNMLECCKNRKIDLFIYTSTAYIYGEPEYLPVDEKHPAKPSTPYGISKYAGEMYCRYYAKKYNVPVVIVRFFNIYGPNQPTGFVIPDITNNILDNNSDVVQLRGSSNDERDFLHISDLCHALLRVIEKRPVHGTFNLGGGAPIKITELAKMISATLKKDVRFECAMTENIKISRLFADISAAKESLNWEPKIELSSGVAEVVSAIKESRN